MRICVPVPAESTSGAIASGESRPRPGVGPLGVIDNSKPRFDVLARAALGELGRRGFTTAETGYVRKPSPTRPAASSEIERLGKATVAVLIGSGD